MPLLKAQEVPIVAEATIFVAGLTCLFNFSMGLC